jgi:Tfp pilus assembly protein FimT
MKGSRDCSTVGIVSIVLWIVTALALASQLQSNRGFALRQSSACIDDTTSWQQQQQQQQRLGFYDDTSRKSEGNVPSIAWLMSFPNSGTSYTLRVVRQVSNTTTATNYGDEHLEHSTNSSVVWDNRTHGPFRAYPNLPLPKDFLLTKTHCASRCVHCGPDGYLETPLSFQQGCLRSNRVRENIQTEEFYSSTHVKRAVHLIRHPMDNVVARFHLSNRHDRSGRFVNNASGFQEWCRILDTSYTWMEQHTRWIDPRLRHLWRAIPCHAEFFR